MWAPEFPIEFKGSFPSDNTSPFVDGRKSCSRNYDALFLKINASLGHCHMLLGCQYLFCGEEHDCLERVLSMALLVIFAVKPLVLLEFREELRNGLQLDPNLERNRLQLVQRRFKGEVVWLSISELKNFFLLKLKHPYPRPFLRYYWRPPSRWYHLLFVSNLI